GAEVPIVAGGKINGHVGNTNVGGLVLGTNDKPGVVDARSMMSAVRVKQTIWTASWGGALAAIGCARATTRQYPARDATARGLMMEYPNDEWDVWFNCKRIGRNFDPSLGFV